MSQCVAARPTLRREDAAHSGARARQQVDLIRSLSSSVAVLCSHCLDTCSTHRLSPAFTASTTWGKDKALSLQGSAQLTLTSPSPHSKSHASRAVRRPAGAASIFLKTEIFRNLFEGKGEFGVHPGNFQEFAPGSLETTKRWKSGLTFCEKKK